MATVTCKAYSGTTELPNTPILSVNPSTDWPGTGDTVSNNGSGGVQITPIPVYPGYGRFKHWEIRKGDPGTHSGGVFSVPGGESSHARAYFKLEIPNPDPCQAARDYYNELINVPPYDPPPPAVAVANALAALNHCETENGEPLTNPVKTA
jgi:hypothetical protein